MGRRPTAQKYKPPDPLAVLEKAIDMKALTATQKSFAMLTERLADGAPVTFEWLKAQIQSRVMSARSVHKPMMTKETFELCLLLFELFGFTSLGSLCELAMISRDTLKLYFQSHPEDKPRVDHAKALYRDKWRAALSASLASALQDPMLDPADVVSACVNLVKHQDKMEFLYTKLGSGGAGSGTTIRIGSNAGPRQDEDIFGPPEQANNGGRQIAVIIQDMSQAAPATPQISQTISAAPADDDSDDDFSEFDLA